jgi:hypothetical protein
MKGQGLEFDGSGKFKGSVQQAMDAVRAIIRSRFGGAMDDLSRSSGGLFSTLKGNFDALFRELGTPLNEALKPALASGIQFLAGLAPEARRLGEGFASALRAGLQIFSSGQLGEVLSLSLRLGFGEAINFGAGLMRGLMQSVGTALLGTFIVAVKFLSAITQPSWWAGLGQALIAAATAFGAAMLNTVADITRGMSRIPGFGWLGGGADAFDRKARDARVAAAQLAKGVGDTGLGKAIDETWQRMAIIGGKMIEGVKAGLDSPRVFDTTSLRKRLAETIESAAADAKLAALADEINKARSDGMHDAASAPSPAKSATAPFFKGPASDTLSQVGLFIGAGGPRGQRAVEDTARHTATLVKLTSKMLGKATTPVMAGAVF